MTENPTFTSVEKLHMEREKLLQSTRKYKEALEDQVSGVKDNALKFAVQGLVFGGVAAGTFLLIRAFGGKKKTATARPQAPAQVTFQSTLYTSIQGYIISFLLSLAKEKITQILEEYLRKKSNEGTERNPS
jgi:hypothetical protein